MLPAESLVHERNRARPPAAEKDRRERHALGILPVGVDDRALRGGGGETRIRMRCFATGGRRPFLAFPIDGPGGSGDAGVFPPDIAVGR